MDGVQLLERALDEAQSVVDGVRPDQMGDPTPCTEFDVRALLNHLTMAATLIADGVAGRGIDMSTVKADVIGDDAPGAFRQAAKNVLESWHEPGVLERDVLMPFGDTPGPFALSFTTVELYAHTLDTAMATGQEGGLDPGLAEDVLGIVQQLPLDNFRMPGVFGPEVECDAGAPAHRRLLALLGRQA